MPAKPLTQEQKDDACRLKSIFERVKSVDPSKTQEAIAAACGWKTQGAVSQYMNGKIPLNLSALFKFCDALGVQPEEISPTLAEQQMIPAGVKAAYKSKAQLSLSSDTQFSFARAESRPVEVNLSEHPDLKEVPRVKFKLSAGVSGYAVEPEAGNGKPIFFRKDWFESNGYDPERLFAVLVSGQSMETSLWDGDLVVINTADTKPHDGDVYAINYEGELVIKRMRRDFGQWLATSDNPDQRRYAPKRCTEDVKIIGRVVYKQSERI